MLSRPGYFVEPTIVRAQPQWPLVQRETFAPILYVMTFHTLDEAVAMQNGVPQGLSSALFTNNLRHGERFISASGSDCGIANINIGTSGAEIGGAFGGEKETGGGREAGSDAWKAYAAANQYGQLGDRAAAGTRHQVRPLALLERMGVWIRTANSMDYWNGW